ncbi:CinA family protein [Pseudoroseomonas cervicalis]|uniref:CinA family protein n=1 Tax=Teichococcus cervicalis TaxID=204525 RepID=UPI002787E6E0|nr:nicotinamide-nucleotide amidohydrolase family protein [Pseudoroseomonas cervicalis]MDQ1079815.1 nicotinamide-nucleotide amidase [Pseudoroseomonas cervicalis]
MSLLDDTVLDRSAALLRALQERGMTLATAESCTGGLVSAALTAHAGSSATLLAGYVTYSNEAKLRMLDVPRALLERHGAVSAEVARAMAEGALRDSGADLAVSITGIAGPGGATAGKPVGLVHLAVAGAGLPVLLHHEIFPGDRAAVRRASLLCALALVARQAGA